MLVVYVIAFLSLPNEIFPVLDLSYYLISSFYVEHLQINLYIYTT